MKSIGAVAMLLVWVLFLALLKPDLFGLYRFRHLWDIRSAGGAVAVNSFEDERLFFNPAEAISVWRTPDWSNHMYMTSSGNFIKCQHFGILVRPSWYYYGHDDMVARWFVEHEIEISLQDILPSRIRDQITEKRAKRNGDASKL